MYGLIRSALIKQLRDAVRDQELVVDVLRQALCDRGLDDLSVNQLIIKVNVDSIHSFLVPSYHCIVTNGFIFHDNKSYIKHSRQCDPLFYSMSIQRTCSGPKRFRPKSREELQRDNIDLEKKYLLQIYLKIITCWTFESPCHNTHRLRHIVYL